MANHVKDIVAVIVNAARDIAKLLKKTFKRLMKIIHKVTLGSIIFYVRGEAAAASVQELLREDRIESTISHEVAELSSVRLGDESEISAFGDFVGSLVDGNENDTMNSAVLEAANVRFRSSAGTYGEYIHARWEETYKVFALALQEDDSHDSLSGMLVSAGHEKLMVGWYPGYTDKSADLPSATELVATFKKTIGSSDETEVARGLAENVRKLLKIARNIKFFTLAATSGDKRSMFGIKARYDTRFKNAGLHNIVCIWAGKDSQYIVSVQKHLQDTLKVDEATKDIFVPKKDGGRPPGSVSGDDACCVIILAFSDTYLSNDHMDRLSDKVASEEVKFCEKVFERSQRLKSEAGQRGASAAKSS